jgi:hypothetical protein
VEFDCGQCGPVGCVWIWVDFCMTINLFVGDCNKDLSINAKKFDKTAYLLDSSNFDQYLALSNTTSTAYTSAADLPKISKDRAVFYEVLQKADQIYYRPSAVWSDHNSEFSLQNQQQLTEYFLYLVNQEKNNVDGLDLSLYEFTPYLTLMSERVCDDAQLWIAGCSIAAGVGVAVEEKYAFKISQQFNGQFSNLALPGSSLEFAADQILRSDIRKGDTVIWGLTAEYRAPYWDRLTQQVKHLAGYTFDYHRTNKADDITDETRLYKAVISFNQVANFCTKIGARLIAVPIICSEALRLLIKDHRLPYQPGFIDLGTDKLHPGPKQHQWYANHINEIINKLNSKEGS